MLTMSAAAKKASEITKEKETQAAARMAEKQAKAAEQLKNKPQKKRRWNV